MEETDKNGNYKYVGQGIGNSNSEYAFSTTQNGVVAIRLNILTKEDILDKGRRIAKRWFAWICVDPFERLIVSVVWRAVKSGEGTRMQCGMCRSDRSKKCRHETACHIESQIRRSESSS